MGTIKNRRRKTEWDRTQTEIQGARDRSDHLLDRISDIEHAIVRLHKMRCGCGSRETVSTVGRTEVVVGTEIGQSYGIKHYRFGEIRCFYCHRLLEAYGVRG